MLGKKVFLLFCVFYNTRKVMRSRRLQSRTRKTQIEMLKI